MRAISRQAAAAALGALILTLPFAAALAGDSLSGKIIAVRSGEVVELDYRTGQYVVHIIGIDAVSQSTAKAARAYVSKLVFGKRARMRFIGRAGNGEMMSRLFTDEPRLPIIDVGVELVRLGLAKRAAGDETRFGYKYGELSAAENEARRARRGLWAAAPP
jgi:endonuclease YncB( thermonuclease family)